MRSIPQDVRGTLWLAFWETMMLLGIWNTVCDYLGFYQHYAGQRWSSITPSEYGTLLIIVFVIGWLLLKSANRK